MARDGGGAGRAENSCDFGKIRVIQAETATSTPSPDPREYFQAGGSSGMAVSSLNWAGPHYRVLSEEKRERAFMIFKLKGTQSAVTPRPWTTFCSKCPRVGLRPHSHMTGRSLRVGAPACPPAVLHSPCATRHGAERVPGKSLSLYCKRLREGDRPSTLRQGKGAWQQASFQEIFPQRASPPVSLLSSLYTFQNLLHSQAGDVLKDYRTSLVYHFSEFCTLRQETFHLVGLLQGG